MRIPKIIYAFLLCASYQASAQFDYELFEHFSTKKERQLNSRLISITELQQDDLDRWNKISFTEFNVAGMPVRLIRYDEKGSEKEKKEFGYSDKGYISNIETYKNGKHAESAEFATDLSGKVISYTDYGNSSADGEKLFIWKTDIEYNSNGTLSRMIQLQGRERDTVEMNFYDTMGIKTLSVWRMEGLSTARIVYNWNKDKTEMKEIHYGRDKKPNLTITHKYKGDKEVEKIDPSSSSARFYWKYNNVGRLVETNELYFSVQYFTYDVRGYMKTKTIRNPFPEPAEKEQANKFEFKYEYQFRK